MGRSVDVVLTLFYELYARAISKRIPKAKLAATALATVAVIPQRKKTVPNNALLLKKELNLYNVNRETFRH